MLHQAMDVLRLFGSEELELSMAEVSRRLGRPPSTVSRLLRSMADSGFLDRDPTSGRYSLGWALAPMASLAERSSGLLRIARATLLELAAETQETTYLGVLRGSVAVLTDGVASPRGIRLAFTPGEHLALHATATGKCLLAWRAEADIRRLVGRRLAAPTKGTITDPERLLEALAKVRVRGYATAYLEWEDDLAAAAAPIRDQDGKVLAALSVGGPASRIRREDLEKLGELTRRHALEASAALGFGRK
jgi:DNA-binding IclR family transcriptional regulator